MGGEISSSWAGEASHKYPPYLLWLSNAAEQTTSKLRGLKQPSLGQEF